MAAVHHELVRAGLRTRCSLVVDSGEPREVHHVACLVGYGADAVHPWLAGDEIVPALGKGLLKVMSKMGVSTVSAYRGAQVFEAIGLGPELIERHFVGTPSKLGGLGLRGLAREVLERHERTYLPAGGLYRWRRDGERHGWNPDTVAALQRGEWRRYVEASDARLAPRGAARAARVPRAVADPAGGRRAGDRDHEALRHRARCRSARSRPRRTRRSRWR